MTTNSKGTGCGACLVDLLFGVAVGWCCGACFFGRLADPPKTNARAEICAALLGAAFGLLVPEFIRLLERAGAPREASRTAFSLAAAAILGAAYGRIFENGCISGMLTLSFAACVLFFLDAVLGGSAGVIAPLAHGARNELVKILLKAIAGMLVGLIGALLRLHLNVLAVTTVEHARFFMTIMLVAGALIYPLLLLLFRGKEAVRGIKVIMPIINGALFALIIGILMTQPTPSLSPSWSETVHRANWVWVPMGMFLGVMITVIVGGLQSVLLLVYDNAAMRYVGAVLVDGVGDLLGRPRREKEATLAAVDVPLTPGQRSAAGCIGAMSFVGILCFGLMALCFGGGGEVFSKDDKDVARLGTAKAGCPPSCARGDFSAWSLARTGTLRGADFTEADLQSAALWSANLNKATFRGARMRGAKLMFAELRGADLTDADLRGAVLTGAQLQKAVLDNANLEDALLQRADLSGAKLKNVKLKGAIFDAATVWPASYDPRAAGAKMDGEP